MDSNENFIVGSVVMCASFVILVQLLHGLLFQLHWFPLNLCIGFSSIIVIQCLTIFVLIIALI
jgi:hypothetical protein